MTRTSPERWPKAAVAFMFCMLVAACGGGDGGPAAPPDPAGALPASLAVKPPPTAIEPGVAATFGSDVPAGSALGFAWDFGDGGTSTETAPSHTYAKVGDYDVTLTLTDEKGATRQATLRVSVSHASIVAGLVCSAPDQAGWCWQRPKPSGNGVADIFFADATTGWAVGDAGSILATTDGGATWKGQLSMTTNALRRVRFANASVGWALGDEGTLLRTVDGGAHWTAQTTGGDSAAYTGSLWVIDPMTAVVSDDDSRTYATTDGGLTWSATGNVQATLVTPGGTMWASNWWEGVSKSSDLGKTFVPSLPASLVRPSLLAFSDELHGWVLGHRPDDYSYELRLYRTTDGGAGWQAAAGTGLPAYLEARHLAFVGSSDGWMLTGNTLLRSRDAGESWTPVTLPPDAYYIGAEHFTALDANTVWFGSYPGIYMTSDAGANWKLLAVEGEFGGDGTRLQRLDAATLLLRYGPRAYLSKDGGNTWQQVLGGNVSEVATTLQGLWFFDSKNGQSLGSDGYLMRTDDGGASWKREALAPAGEPCYWWWSFCSQAKLQFFSATGGWLLQPNGAISSTSDGGKTWHSPLTPVVLRMQDIAFSDAGTGWGVASSGGIHSTADGGFSWTQRDASSHVFHAVRFASATLGLAVGQGGRIARTTDGGATWVLRASGTLQNLTRVAFADANNAWAIGHGGMVLRSADGGDTWARVPVASLGNLRDLQFIDASHGWLIGDQGTVLATTDGGNSWAVQPSGTLNSLNSLFAIDERTVWIVGTEGLVLATVTGGRR